MMRSSLSVLTAMTATLAYAQNSTGQGSASVTSVFIPGFDSLPYVASVMGQSGDVKTLAISCGPGVDSDTCGLPSSVTAICGPSTAYVSAAVPSATFIYDCKVSGSTAAVCAETFQGDVAYIATDTGSVTPSGSTSTVTTETLASTDISYVAITITAGGSAASSAGSATATNAASSAAASVPTAAASASSNAAVGSSQSWQSWAESSQVVQSQSVATASVSSVMTVPATSASASTTTSAPVSQFTGAADKLSAIGNYAAGFLALVGMAL